MPKWWLCPGPGAQLQDERTGRPGGSAGKGPVGAGPRRGHRKLLSVSGDTYSCLLDLFFLLLNYAVFHSGSTFPSY